MLRNLGERINLAKMFLYGASGHARVIMEILHASGVKVEAIIDDDPAVNELDGVEVRHVFKGESPMILTIGNNYVRQRLDKSLDCEWGTAIHESAIVSPSATIGEGTVVMHGAIIQAAAHIGRHSIINSGASIDHECRIGDYVHVSPNATVCGLVEVGDCTWIGAGATIIQCVKIGKNCIIGAGSVVLHDIPDGTKVVGNPAKEI